MKKNLIERIRLAEVPTRYAIRLDELYAIEQYAIEKAAAHSGNPAECMFQGIIFAFRLGFLRGTQYSKRQAMKADTAN